MPRLVLHATVFTTLCLGIAGLGGAAHAARSDMQPRLSPLATKVADGCPGGQWRGPWGKCRVGAYSGPMPGGGFAHGYTGCQPGWWRGPWGECRDTVSMAACRTAPSSKVG